jgi:hypothetical protein
VLLLGSILGLVLVGTSLWDAFETVVLPRRVSRQLRLSRLVYQLTWSPYSGTARRIHHGGRREAYLSYYGPLSLLLLLGVWALVLIFGFAVLQWAGGSAVMSQNQESNFGADLYLSGTTFFTLGLGDVVPNSGPARALTVVEAGVGFAFLALVIGYVPIVYQGFAQRETNVALLDQRAGSPPSAAELLRRNVERGDVTVLVQLLRDCEVWVGNILESHLSYPVLAYFRSQHENQSWVAAVTVILDVSAYVVTCGSSRAARQAGFTFAVSRHAAADLSHILNLAPVEPRLDRLDPATIELLWRAATKHGLVVDEVGSLPRFAERLRAVRATYEPYLEALATYLQMPLPAWAPATDARDNWETTAWDFTSPLPLLGPGSPFDRQPRG